MPERVRRLLAESGAELSAEELLDALWLAERMPGGADAPLLRAGATVPGEPATVPPLPPLPGSPLPEGQPAAGAVPPRPPSGPPAAQAPPPPAPSPLHAAPARAGHEAARAQSVRAPQESALGAGELRLGRALRPLKQRRPDRRLRSLDEEATASAMAETGLPDAVLRPARTRWLELVLLVDDGVSMRLWRRFAAEVRLLMQRSGAFRTIRVYGLDSRGPHAPRLTRRPYESGGTPLPPGTVTDPTGGTLVLVVSDGVGAAWRDGRMRAALDRWACAGPAAVVHALPRRLWEGSGIRAHTWRVTASGRGPANRDWTVTDPVLPPEVARFEGVPVPVLAPTPEAVGAWASLVGSPGASALLPLLAPAPGPPARAPEGDARAELRRFRDAASPGAYRLAAHLAALSPVSVPVMGLVQHALEPEVDAGHLAEVFLGGLMRRTREDGGLDHDFDEETRQILIGSVAGPELARTARVVTSRLMELAGHSPEFPAWLAHPEGAGEVDGAGRPFGWVSGRLLRRMGTAPASGAPASGAQAPAPAPAPPSVALPAPVGPTSPAVPSSPAVPAPPFVGREGSDWVPLEAGDPLRIGPYELFARHRGGWFGGNSYLGHGSGPDSTAEAAGQRPGEWAVVHTVGGRGTGYARRVHDAQVRALRTMDGRHAPRLLSYGSEPLDWLAVEFVRAPDEPGAPDASGGGEHAPDLAAYLRHHRPLSEERFGALGLQMVRAVAAAHGRNLVHGALGRRSFLVSERGVLLQGWGAPGQGPGPATPKPPSRAEDVYGLAGILLLLRFDGRGDEGRTDAGSGPLGAVVGGAGLPAGGQPTGGQDAYVYAADTGASTGTRPEAADAPRPPDPAHPDPAHRDPRWTALYGVLGDCRDPWPENRPSADDLERAFLAVAEHEPAPRLRPAPLGVDGRGRLFALDIAPPQLDGIGPHGLIHGGAGPRRAELAAIVEGFAAANDPAALTVICADRTGALTPSPLPALPHTVWCQSVGDDSDRIRELGTLLRNEAVQRSAVDADRLPWLLVVIDDLDQVVDAQGTFFALVDSLGVLAAGPRVHLLISQDTASSSLSDLFAVGYRIDSGPARFPSTARTLTLHSPPHAPVTLHPAPGLSAPAPEWDHAERHAHGVELLRGGRPQLAHRVLGEAVRTRTAVLGPDHEATLASRYERAFALLALERHGEALAEYRDVARHRTNAFGPSHPDTLNARQQTAFSLGLLGRHSEALSQYVGVLAARQRGQGPDHPDTLRCGHNMAYTLAQLQRYEEALRLFEEVHGLRARQLGETHPDTLVTRRELAHVLLRLGDRARAKQLYESVYAIRNATLGGRHPETRTSYADLDAVTR
ncbi:SAV_2336 N-terminal domain-related protein [Streptomyces sp. NPDC050504]|uniref:SAV_2336 N-terminal domain-related protein n=1 Tax=Streptomyces sp. NPDC050504 TaxID=3365618 RepID=UPI0037898A2C